MAKRRFKEFIKRIIAAENKEDAVQNVFYGPDGIERAEQREELTFEESQLLLDLIEKMA